MLGQRCANPQLSSQYHSTLKQLNFFMKPWRPKGFFQFEITITVLVSFFRFIWIPRLWVYGHYKYFHSFSAGTDFRQQKLTSTDVRFCRLKSVPALKGLNVCRIQYFTGREICQLRKCKCHKIQNCEEPLWPRGSVLGLSVPGIDFWIFWLVGHLIHPTISRRFCPV